MDWGTFLNQTAQDLIDQRVTALSAPSAPVAQTPTGQAYVEGKVAISNQKIMGMPSMVVIGGGVVVALALAYMLLRK